MTTPDDFPPVPNPLLRHCKLCEVQWEISLAQAREEPAPPCFICGAEGEKGRIPGRIPSFVHSLATWTARKAAEDLEEPA